MQRRSICPEGITGKECPPLAGEREGINTGFVAVRGIYVVLKKLGNGVSEMIYQEYKWVLKRR